MPFKSEKQRRYLWVSKAVRLRMPIRRVVDTRVPLAPNEFWHGTTTESANAITAAGFKLADPKGKPRGADYLRGSNKKMKQKLISDSEGKFDHSGATRAGRPKAGGDLGPGVYVSRSADDARYFSHMLEGGNTESLFGRHPGSYKGDLVRVKVNGKIGQTRDSYNPKLSPQATKRGFAAVESKKEYSGINQVVIPNPRNIEVVPTKTRLAPGWTNGEYLAAGSVGAAGANQARKKFHGNQYVTDDKAKRTSVAKSALEELVGKSLIGSAGKAARSKPALYATGGAAAGAGIGAFAVKPVTGHLALRADSKDSTRLANSVVHLNSLPSKRRIAYHAQSKVKPDLVQRKLYHGIQHWEDAPGVVLQRKVRANPDSRLIKLHPRYAEHKLLERAVRDSPHTTTRLYRGVTMHPDDAKLLSVGSVHDRGVQSWSSDQGKATTFADNRRAKEKTEAGHARVVFEMTHHKNALNAAPVGRFNMAEWVSDTPYKIKHVAADEQGNYHVKVRQATNQFRGNQYMDENKQRRAVSKADWNISERETRSSRAGRRARASKDAAAYGAAGTAGLMLARPNAYPNAKKIATQHKQGFGLARTGGASTVDAIKGQGKAAKKIFSTVPHAKPAYALGALATGTAAAAGNIGVQRSIQRFHEGKITAKRREAMAKSVSWTPSVNFELGQINKSMPDSSDVHVKGTLRPIKKKRSRRSVG